MQSSAIAVAADGATLEFDAAAHELRRVDPLTGTIERLAGSGAAAPVSGHCPFDTSDPALAGFLPKLAGIWTDTTGDVFVWPGYDQLCGYGNVYRLDPNDGYWHLAVQVVGGYPGDYHAVTVDKAGDVFVSDVAHAVIREFVPGTDPAFGGTIVAGTLDTPGSAGDGGPATTATISKPDVIAAAGDGSLFLANYNGHTIREVSAATGLISTVAGNGAGTPTTLNADDGLPATQARIDVNAITVAPDGTVYFTDNGQLGISAIRGFSVGGTIRTVVGPASPNSDGNPALCPGTQVASTGSWVLVSCGSTIRSWPADGSSANQPGARVAGVDNTIGVPISPDGVTLDDAFVPLIDAIAQAPDGTIAVATARNIRTLTGLNGSGTLSSVSDRGAAAVAYGADNTLYAALGRGTSTDPSEIVAFSHGAQTVIAGGGSAGIAAAVAGTSVALPQVTALTIDRSRNLLYFDVRNDGRVWSVDPATGVLHLVAGSNSTAGSLTDGEAAVDAPLSPDALAVDQASHALYIATGIPSTTLVRIDGDGTLHVLGSDQQNVAYTSMTVAPDGTIYANDGNLVALHPSGATANDFPDLAGPFTLLNDGRLLALPRRAASASEAAGGLLATATPPDGTFPGTPATVQANPAPGGVTITVSPPAVTRAVVTVTVTQLPFAPPYPTGGPAVATFTTDGTTTPRTFTIDHLGPNGTSGPGLSPDHSYRIAVYTTMNSGTVKVTSAPQTATVVPSPDSTPPATPLLSVRTGGSDIDWTLTLPSDADLQVVHLRWMQGTTAPATPSSGDGIDYTIGAYHPGQIIADYRFFASRMQSYTFAAWAEDSSGNLSKPALAVRAAASQTTGSPVSNVGYQAQGNDKTVVFWTSPWFVSDVRYAVGATPPANPAAGTSAGQIESGWGTGATIPATPGQKVAVSIFNYTNDPTNTFQRQSFVLTGGESTDTLTASAPTAVTAGASPTLTATFTRNGPFATQPLAGQDIDLYEESGNASTWTAIKSALTSATGTASFTVPPQQVTTTYQLRARSADPAPVMTTFTVAVSSKLTAALSSTTVNSNRAVYIHGSLSPHSRTAVKLLRYFNRAWRSVGTSTTTSTGAYRLRYTPSKPGNYLLRMSFTGSKTFAASTSAPLKLRVR